MKKLRIITIMMLSVVMLTGCIGNPYKSGAKHLKNEEYTEAAEKFELAIEKEKKLSESYRGLGIAKWELEQYEEAYQAFTSAVSEGTEETAALYSLMGNCAMQIDKYEEAVTHYEKAISMKDISEELLKEVEFNLVAAYEHAGNIGMAKSTCSAYLEKYPEDEAMLKEAEFLETR